MRQEVLEGIPHPWWYNPSSWKQRVRMALIAAVALAISIYLGLYQWRLIDSVWDPFFGEQSQHVLDSEVSHKIRSWIIIPDAILGALAYLSDIIYALAGCTRRWQYRPWLVILFGIDVIPLGGVSAILVLMQAFVVKQWCFLCLVTAVISLLLTVLAYDEVVSSIIYLHRIKKRAGSRAMWSAFWGKPSDVAYEVGEKMLVRKDVAKN